MNVLGVLFDSKLNWNAHVASAICKSKKSLFALRVLRKYFNNQEMRLLLDSYFYSILYYNAVLWLTPQLCPMMKQAILSISANALRSCMMSNSTELSFIRIHAICQKCTPSQIMSYQAAIHLYKVTNEVFETCSTEQALFLNNVIRTRRQTMFEILKSNRSKIGMNALCNKFYHISKQVSLDSLNCKFVQYKKIMKITFMKNGKT